MCVRVNERIEGRGVGWREGERLAHAWDFYVPYQRKALIFGALEGAKGEAVLGRRSEKQSERARLQRVSC